MRTALLLLAFAFAAARRRPAVIEKGQKEEQRTCLPCHSLRIIHSNRLSRAGWNKELDKMAGWGTKYSDRDAILEYLVATYGDDKPVTPPEMSARQPTAAAKASPIAVDSVRYPGSMMKMMLLGLAVGAMAFGASSVYDFTLNSIDGAADAALAFKGKVVLLVNVASKCGYTPQYAGLEKLYETYKDKGFVIVGVPANNFGAQEPGSNEEIKTFCSRNYNVTFPMMSKVSVKGADTTPLYQYLTDKPPPIPRPAATSNGTSLSSWSTRKVM